MISWIKGELIHLWQHNNKCFILVNCQGLGYEIQILESIFIKLKTKQISNTNIILWLKHIKKEDSDSLFGFITKDQRDFFVEILSVKGIGAQIGISILNKFTMNEIINAINIKDKILISSVPGIGQKMTERLILELGSKLTTKLKFKEEKKSSETLVNNNELNTLLEDLNMTLKSLNYPNKEIKNIFPILVKDLQNNKFKTKEDYNISFETLLKQAMNYLDNKSRNIGQ